MKNNSFFKTFWLSLYLLGVCAVGLMQWRNLEHTKKELHSSSKVVSEFAKKWDKQTGRVFGEEADLNLNVNAIPLEIIVANLAQSGDITRYLTAYPVIKFAKGNLKKADFLKVLPRLREIFFEVINQKSPEEILGKDGISKLKADLVRELNEIMLPLEIEKVYFLSVIVS
jgi:flagellar basal body-associated protein FliL